MARVQRDVDLAIGRRDHRRIAQRQVDGTDGDAKNVDDRAQFLRWDFVADGVNNAREVAFSLFDARSRRAAHVQPQLAGIDGRKEVAADERRQRGRHPDKDQEDSDGNGATSQHPGKDARETALKSDEGAIDDAGPVFVTLGGQQVLDKRRHQRARQEIRGEHGEDHDHRQGREQ